MFNCIFTFLELDTQWAYIVIFFVITVLEDILLPPLFFVYQPRKTYLLLTGVGSVPIFDFGSTALTFVETEPPLG